MSTPSIAGGFEASGITSLSALEQAARIRDGSVTSAELTEIYLARIRHHNPAVGAFVRLFERSARREAEAADRARARGDLVGPFHGVPTGVKDLHRVRRSRIGLGSRAFSWLWSPTDDNVVANLRAAGFVILGKTTTSELGLLPIVETEVAPPTRNPWDLMRTAGGSSGGAGAAVAAGLLPIAPGTDGAGSVRIPASLNGLVGLKPSRGLVPNDNARLDDFGLTAVGPLARTIDDAAALLDALADPLRADHLRRSREPLPKLRIGVVREPLFGELHDGILARVDAAVEVLREAGHHVEERPCPPATLDDFIPVYQRFLARIPVPLPGRLSPVVRWFWEEGRKVPHQLANESFRAFEVMGLAAMDGLDIMVSPTVPILPPLVGEFAHLPPAEMFAAAAPLGSFTALANVNGQPALTVPFGLADGLPAGVQLMGHRGRDALLFALGRLLEAADHGNYSASANPV